MWEGSSGGEREGLGLWEVYRGLGTIDMLLEIIQEKHYQV